jgi:hypothetical protein
VLGFRFFLDEQLANRIVRIHQLTQLIPDLSKHIIRVSLSDLLHSLYFLVVLDLLRVRRIGYLLKLHLQVIKNFLDLTCRTFDVLV